MGIYIHYKFCFTLYPHYFKLRHLKSVVKLRSHRQVKFRLKAFDEYDLKDHLVYFKAFWDCKNVKNAAGSNKMSWRIKIPQAVRALLVCAQQSLNSTRIDTTAPFKRAILLFQSQKKKNIQKSKIPMISFSAFKSHQINRTKIWNHFCLL